MEIEQQFSKKMENDKFTIFRIIDKIKSKCCFSRVVGRGSKIQDFMMILSAMFDSSALEVGAKIYKLTFSRSLLSRRTPLSERLEQNTS